MERGGALEVPELEICHEAVVVHDSVQDGVAQDSSAARGAQTECEPPSRHELLEVVHDGVQDGGAQDSSAAGGAQTELEPAQDEGRCCATQALNAAPLSTPWPFAS